MSFLLGQTRHSCGSHSKRHYSHSEYAPSNCHCWHCRENAQQAFRPFSQPPFPVSAATVPMPGLSGHGRIFPIYYLTIYKVPFECQIVNCKWLNGKWRGACSPFIPPAAGLRLPQSRLGQTRPRRGPQPKRHNAQPEYAPSNSHRWQRRENAQHSAYAGR